MNKKLPFFALLCLFTGASVADLSANRFREYTERYASPNRPATPVVGSYLGGGGNNYLIAGDFLPSGALYLAGNAYGPTFSLPNTRLVVLGQDTSAPEFVMPTNRNDHPSPPRAWEHHEGAPFIALLGPDYDGIDRAIRFPWGACVITDLITDPHGNLFITGIVGENFSRLGNYREASADGLAHNGEIFFGKLKTDLTGFDWLLKLPDNNDNTPQMRYIGDGIVSVVGENGFHFNANGELLRAQKTEEPGSWAQAVCFKTFARLAGHFHRTNTGWEPWHRPVAIVKNPEGNHRSRFYSWSERLVGTNWSRLVSDSAMHVGLFDLNGQPIIAGWSDGGNSVWTRVPYDITRSARAAAEENTGHSTGLPFSTWGAGVGSFLHLNRIDFETGNPLSYSLFISYLRDRNAPSSVTANNLDVTVDNELLLAGGSAFGLIQTRDLALNSLDYDEDYIGGNFFAILDENWTDIRFSSAMPGAGRLALERQSRNRGSSWRFGSAHVNGKTMVVAVSGAYQHEKFTPRNPISGFGDGILDGLFVVLEMESSERLPPPEFRFPHSSSRDVDEPRNDEDLEGLFIVNERGMRNSYSVLAMHDTTAKKWPIFYLGRPVGENLVNANGFGTILLRGAHNQVQINDLDEEQHHRRLGGRQRNEDGYRTLELEITFNSQTEANAVIRFNDREVNVTGPSGFRNSSPVGQGIQMSGYFRTTKGALGLAENAAETEEEIIIRWWAPGRPAPEEVTADPTRRTSVTRLGQPRTWTSQDGREIKATFKALENNTVTLVLEGNREAEVPLNSLSQEDVDFILQEKGLRVWTSADGRQLIASFLRTHENSVVIETPEGQEFQINLENLSGEDQNFVREQQ